MEQATVASKLDPSPARNADRPAWRRFAAPAIIVTGAAIAVAPQLIRGNSCGHDFDVHLVSWLDCANAWRHGIAYPHWTPSANWGAGEPRFVYYPPLTWMAGAALGLAFGWHFAPIVFTFLCLAGTGLAARALALEACDEAVATLAGCAAMFSGFALFTAYERAAFPEFTGGVWLPLLVLFALRDRHPEAAPARRAFDGSTVPLALALAAAWLSNLPLGVIAGYLLAAVALLAALLKRSWAPVLRAAVATALGLGMAAIYWLPAALERNWVDIRQATDDPGYNFENNWAFAHHANPELALHDQVLRQVSWIAITMIAVALAAIFVCRLRGTLPIEKVSRSKRWWIPLAAIPAVVLFLLFPISYPVWRLLPEMAFLQYPWRWLEAVEAPMAIFFAAAVWPAPAMARKKRWARPAVAAACSAAFLAATAYAGMRFFQVCYPEDAVPGVLSDYRSGAGFEGMFEYEPPGADITQIASGLPDACLVSDPTEELGKPDSGGGQPAWNAGSCLATFTAASGTNAEHLRLRAEAPAGGFLVLRLLRFPSWQVRVNGNPVVPFAGRADGLMAIPVKRGPLALDVDWKPSPYAATARWVTALALLALIACALLEKPGRRPVNQDRRAH